MSDLEPPTKKRKLADDDSEEEETETFTSDDLNQLKPGGRKLPVGGQLSQDHPVYANRKKFESSTPHMVLRTTQVDYAQVIFKTLKGLLNHCEFQFNEHGMFLQAMDSTNTILVDLQVMKDDLMSGYYECNRNYRVAVDIQAMAEFVFYGKSYDIMEFRLEGENPDYIFFKFERGTSCQTQKLRLNMLEGDPLDPCDMIYHSSVVFPSAMFRESVNRYKANGAIENVIFIKTPTEFTIKVDQEMGTIEDHFYPSSEQDVTFKNDVPTDEGESDGVVTVERAGFSLRKVINCTRITKATKYVSIFMPEEESGQVCRPLKLEYNVAAWGTISFYIAPKVEDNDE